MLRPVQVAPIDQQSDGVTLAVHASGVVRIVAGGAADGLSDAGRARLQEAMARGAGHGVLWLGSSEPTAMLAPELAFFRDLGKLFVTRLCGAPDLEEQRDRAQVTCPVEELARLADAVPPMPGGEYIDAARLRGWWDEVHGAFRDEIRGFDDTVQSWLQQRSAVWNLVGRVCFHLAENRNDEEYPFAFLATYTSRVSSKAKVQHVPLSRAVEESAGRKDKGALLSLLVPVQRAAERSQLVAELLESADLYEPLAWTPAEAHRFLREIPACEAAGVIVRVPDWWKPRRPPRPEVSVTVGGKPPKAGTLGVEAMLDFAVRVTLDGETLSEAELRALMTSADGLALVKGKWVELDRDKLRAVLDHWRTIERSAQRDGISFLEGMRLLAGAPAVSRDVAAEDDTSTDWSRVVAGDWLAKTLAGLRDPDRLGQADPGAALRATLRPYQQVGVRWLRFATTLRLGVCLADDMGLGKTIQVLGLLLLHRRGRGAEEPPHLLVVPASLLANWQAEIERFAPELRVLIAHPSVTPPTALADPPTGRLKELDLVITTYGSVARFAWLGGMDWSLVILDEAQAIKNPGAKQTRAVKALRARARIALTGTPVENRLGDLWSLFDFLNPGLLGSAAEFGRFAKKLAERPEEPYAPLRRLIQPYLLRRLKTDRSVIADLPSKTEVKTFCHLAKPQAALYQRAVDDLTAELRAMKQGIQRRGVVLAYLLRLKQICNHPSQWLGDGGWGERESGKLLRLRELGEAIAAKQEKVLVFTQFREATAPLATFLADVFGAPGVVLHGGTAVKERMSLVRRFQEDDRVPFFVLSVKAGGTGLNLTAASHVVHFDRWWNPAVEDQATDRAFRIGQQRNVLVHKLVCRGTIEEKIDALIESKQGMSRELLSGGAEALLTEMRDDELLSAVSLDLRRATAEP
jgi:superfamily II DNA or RNA helicase